MVLQKKKKDDRQGLTAKAKAEWSKATNVMSSVTAFSRAGADAALNNLLGGGKKRLPAHLAHQNTATHRKSRRKNHRGKSISVKAKDGGHWFLAADPESGDSYWYCEETGAASWTNPLEDAAAAAAAEKEEEGGLALADKAGRSKRATLRNARKDGWEQITDDATGAAYWWNKASGKTMWEEPPVGV